MQKWRDRRHTIQSGKITPRAPTIKKKKAVADTIVSCLIAAPILIGLYVLSRHHYLVFHSLVELSAIAVAWSIFLLIWSARGFKTPAGFLILGAAYVFVGLLDLMHTISYEGMGVLAEGGPDKATQLWIAARSIEAAALLFFPLSLSLRIPAWIINVFPAAVTGLLLGSIFRWNTFPACFDSETGLTPFTITAEYIIISVLAVAGFLTRLRREIIGRRIAFFLLGSIIATILSELSFTLSIHPHSLSDMTGHLLKLGSFFLLYRALIVERLEHPLEALKRQMRFQAALLDQVSDAVVATDSDFRITSWNKAAERIYGWTADQAAGKPIDDLLKTRWQNHTAEWMQARLSEQGSWSGDAKQKSRQGDDLYIEASASRLHDAAGNRTGAIIVNRDITQKQAFETALKESEFKYRDIVETAQEGIWILDGNGITTFVNDKITEMLGYKKEEMLGRSFLAFMEKENVALAEYYFERRQQGLKENHDFRFRRKDGAALWTIISTNPLIDHKGTFKGVLGMLVDITARKQIEKSLAESEQRYRSMVNVLPDLLFRLNGEKRFTYVQASRPEMLLAPPEEITGKTLWDLLPPDIAELNSRKYHATLASNEMQIFHYNLTMDGVRKECETRMIPYSGDEVLGILRDVTKIRAAERKLKESEARYNAVINDQTELICRFLADGTLTFVNQAYCRYFSKKEAELLGHRFSPLIPEDDLELVKHAIASLSPEHPITTYEHRVITANTQNRWMEWTDRAILNDKGELIEYQGVGRDITERKELQKRLMESSEREQKRLGEELHDGLCQDLKGLEMEATLLEDMIAESGADPSARQLASSVGSQANAATKKAYAVARGMLPIELDAESFGSSLEELARGFREQTDALLTCTIDHILVPENELQAHHLYRIAQEALSNAIHHAQAHSIELSWQQQKQYAVLAIHDNGIGIEPENPAKSGGLGLTIMNSRAQSIGGTLTIQGGPGKGTEIKVKLAPQEKRV